MNDLSFSTANLPILKYNTIIIGSGAAAYGAALQLYKLGQTDIAIITEGRTIGTSRNTGSDKQTYYKLSLAGGERDSVRHLASTLFGGGATDGDTALAEAALSTRAFHRLVELGVPFPCNQYGEYVGYKTDHDPYSRATSVGPLTSRVMTEELEKEVFRLNIAFYDQKAVVHVIVHEGASRGVITINKHTNEIFIFNAVNIIYATGGSAGMYTHSVYPPSHTGGTGTALLAGVKGKNLTESQYGIASTKFRWNLSGTYQQVIPRYFSTDADGGGYDEFLDKYFPNYPDLLEAIFLKGYQWPFDPRKIANYGSSMIDILVYIETIIKKRRVFIDYRENPSGATKNGVFDFSLLKPESYNYLNSSFALLPTPIDRLAKMNRAAIELYLSKGIDLATSPLEIAACAQHNNGGLDINLWWESNLKHFFPVGEVAGTHGVYRPGGAALNAGQVGGIRAAEFIYHQYNTVGVDNETFIKNHSADVLRVKGIIDKLSSNISTDSNVALVRKKIGDIMSANGAIVRDLAGVNSAISELKALLDNFFDIARISSTREIFALFKNFDIAISAYAYLNAIADYIQSGGVSRGSYLIISEEETDLPFDGFPPKLAYKMGYDNFHDKVQETILDNFATHSTFRDVRPIPDGELWFENVWNDFKNKKIYT